MASEQRLICVGHSALDHVYRISSFPSEPTKVRALEAIEIGGGMAANAAVAIVRLGGKAELWSRVGEDNAGAIIRASLKAEKVDVRYLEGFEDARSSTSAVIVDDRGERLIVGMRDTSIPSSTNWLPLERIAGAAAILADLRWLEATRVVFGRARQVGVPTILDADLGAREALPDLLVITDFAVFSAAALREFIPGGSDEDRLRDVLQRGPKHAGVTLGADGYLWLDENGLGRQSGYRVDAVDTTGAGDAFHGALALAIADGRPMREAAKVACAVAALKCTRLGSRAGLPTKAELTAFLGRH